MLRRWWWSGILAGIFCSVLLAREGTIQTIDGKQLQGDIQNIGDSKSIAITDHGVMVTVPRENIAKIEYSDDKQNEFSRRLAALAPTDVRGRVELSRWALDRNLFNLARQAALDAQRINPDDPDAQMLLQLIQSQQVLQTRPPAASEPSSDTPSSPDSSPAPPGNWLSDADVNVIRQRELREGENANVIFSVNVRRDYLRQSGADAKAFDSAGPVAQALQIVEFGNPELSAQVQILNDPAALSQFHSAILPEMFVGCAASGCHGGKNGQDFFLYTNVPKPVQWYTDFYILRIYQQKLPALSNAFGNGPVMLPMIDPSHPSRSLIIQYGLPRNLASMPHPDVAGFRPLFSSENDSGYRQVIRWISQSLKPFEPDYGIQFALPSGRSAATNPSTSASPSVP